MGQTKKAYSIDNLHDLSAVHRQLLEPYLAEGPLPPLIYAPQCHALDALEHYLLLLSDRLILMTDRGQETTLKILPLDHLTAVVFHLSLDESYIALRGRSNGSGHYQEKIHFRFPDNQLFRQFIVTLRHRIDAPIPDGKASRSLGYLRELNLRFYDYLDDLMIAGDRVVESIYQPRQAQINMPAQLLVLTTTEILSIRAPEDLDESVGGSFVFYPLRHVTGGRLDSIYGDLTFDLNLNLDRGEIISIRFAKEALSAFKDFDRILMDLLAEKRLTEATG
jgi:hypothetical protein